MPRVNAQESGDLMTLSEAAKYLRVSERTVWAMAQGGELPCFKLRWQWRFSREALRDHIARSSGAKAPTA